jgi:hypothetical protein
MAEEATRTLATAKRTFAEVREAEGKAAAINTAAIATLADADRAFVLANAAFLRARADRDEARLAAKESKLTVCNLSERHTVAVFALSKAEGHHRDAERAVAEHERHMQWVANNAERRTKAVAS